MAFWYRMGAVVPSVLVGLAACGGDAAFTSSDPGTVPDASAEGSSGADGTSGMDGGVDSSNGGAAGTGGATATGGAAGTPGTGGATATGGAAGASGTGGAGIGCGNGAVEAGEECDDGNTNAGDGCDSACLIEAPPSCGDGKVDYANGEECDDKNAVSGDGCSKSCLVEKPSSCGDGTLDLSVDEECDDGNVVSGDGCSLTCQLEAVGATCGDGSQQPLESCDDGNVVNGDGCNPTCNLKGTTELFVGQKGAPGFADDPTGLGIARVGGLGTLASDQDYLYLADSPNRRVRRIEIATRIVTTLAGNGTNAKVDAPVGANASFAGLEGITTDGKVLWIADEASCVIRRVDLTPPHAVTTVAGDGTCTGHADGIGTAARFQGLRGLTYWNGLVYLLNPSAHTLRSFNPSTGEVKTLAGAVGQNTGRDGPGLATGTPATFGHFNSPRYMTHDNSGMLYIADNLGFKIRAYNTVLDYLGTFSGDGTCGYVDGIGAAAKVRRPRGLTSDGTSLFWVEFEEHTIRQGVLATRSTTTLVGKHCNGASCTGTCTGGYAEGTGTAAQFTSPFDVEYHHPSNSLFVVDSGNAVIRRIR